MAAPQNTVVSVAIVTWNRRQLVLRAIESVVKQSYRYIEIVVVDSASSDGTIEAINENYPEVRTIRLHRNLGCPEGRNVALINCSGDIIFSLDDDAWLAPSTLKICVERFQREPRLGVIACQVLLPEVNSPNNAEECYTYLFDGGACAVRKKTLDKTNYFPSDFFRQAEEVDLALQILEMGYRILHYPEAIVYHERPPNNRYNKLTMFYGCRNELYTVIRRYPLPLIPIGVVWKIVHWNWIGIKKCGLLSILRACISVLLRLPKLFTQRDPVSLRTIKKVLMFRFRK